MGIGSLHQKWSCMPQLHEMSFLAIFAPHCDVPCASPWPLTPQPMPHLKSIGNTLSYGCKLVSVAQFVQKLFNVAGPFSGLKWLKWLPISQYMKKSFFSKRALGMILMR